MSVCSFVDCTLQRDSSMQPGKTPSYLQTCSWQCPHSPPISCGPFPLFLSSLSPQQLSPPRHSPLQRCHSIKVSVTQAPIWINGNYVKSPFPDAVRRLLEGKRTAVEGQRELLGLSDPISVSAQTVPLFSPLAPIPPYSLLKRVTNKYMEFHPRGSSFSIPAN